jgi:hypothetical protein
MQSVELTLDPGTNFYIMQIRDATSSKDIMWYVSGVDGEYVRLTKGGSSTCTITDNQLTCTAGENLAVPIEYNWGP